MVELKDQPDRDDELEQALRTALHPMPAPDGFADRVLSRARQWAEPPSAAPRKRSGFSPVLQWAIAAVLLVTVSVGGFAIHRRQRRIAGERARDQVLLALRITSITIRAVRQQVDKSNHNNGPQQETP